MTYIIYNMEMNMPEQQETIFADGMIFNRKHENAPDFVLGSISFKADDFIAFLQKHKNADGWVNVDMLKPKDKDKKPYFKLNTWTKPADAINPVVPPSVATEQPPAPEGAVAVAQAQEPADIPF